jgi:hypothetical protein
MREARPSDPDASIRGGGRRTVVWAAVLGALAAAVVLLLLAQASKEPAGGTAPKEGAGDGAGGGIEIRVRDGAGHAIETAAAYTAASADAPFEPAGDWDPEAGLLVLPGPTPRVLLQARGHRSLVLEDVRASREVVLEEGLVVRLVVPDSPVLPGPPYRLTFQIRPDPASFGAMSEDQAQVVVDLMAAKRPPPEYLPASTRAGFGFEASPDQAEAGIVVPLPGRYVARWGLFDTKRALWYSLPAGTRQTFDVDDTAEPLVVEIPIATEAVDRTREELDAIHK